MKAFILTLAILLLSFPTLANGQTSAQDAIPLFTRLLKSKPEAEYLAAQLAAYSSETPYQSGLIGISQRLIVAGFKPKQIMLILTPCGDMAAALDFNDQGYSELVGRMASLKNGRDDAVYLNLIALSDIGVPAFEILGEAIGKSARETEILAQRRRLRSSAACDALLAMYAQKYKGAALEARKIIDRRN